MGCSRSGSPANVYVLIAASSPSTSNQADDPRQQHGSADRNQYGVDHSALAGESQAPHNEAANQSSNDADHQIHDDPVSGTPH